MDVQTAHSSQFMTTYNITDQRFTQIGLTGNDFKSMLKIGK